ncbi:hypothetical protein Syun_013453 [Stephania yunnanensis]|uniref:Uncharacterized protein n=1 Tax=Stephania yunnanensis TaxID=152371 RepID=A0AAP0PGK6_9MAGN
MFMAQGARDTDSNNCLLRNSMVAHGIYLFTSVTQLIFLRGSPLDMPDGHSFLRRISALGIDWSSQRIFGPLGTYGAMNWGFPSGSQLLLSRESVGISQRPTLKRNGSH